MSTFLMLKKNRESTERSCKTTGSLENCMYRGTCRAPYQQQNQIILLIRYLCGQDLKC